MATISAGEKVKPNYTNFTIFCTIRNESISFEYYKRFAPNMFSKVKLLI